MLTEVAILAVSWLAGCLGALLGIGGGMILIPVLTLGFGINIRYAVGASIVSVIATSSGAAVSYVRDGITNIRLAIFLEMATTIGAFVGASFSTLVNTRFLFILFALVLLQSAFLMWKRGKVKVSRSQPAHPWSHSLNLNSSYPDPVLKKDVHYSVSQVPAGFFYMLGAGTISGLLGIGSGALKVLAMDSAMGLPIKVSSATSNFMMGVTAAASAGTYYMRGDIVPDIAAPVALGVLAGSLTGSRIMVHLPSQKIRNIFIFVLIVMAIQMALRGLRHG